MKVDNSTLYLQNVLKNWTQFCKFHRPFEKAIKDVLAENERLKAEIEILKGKV